MAAIAALALLVVASGPSAMTVASPAARQALQFDAAAIKPSRETRPRATPLQGGRYTATGMSMRDLLIAAYLVHSSQIVGGPRWMESARFDINAVIENPPSNSLDVHRLLLRSLLADRFGLRLHIETRVIDAFVLRLARPGTPLPQAIQRSQSKCDGVTVDEQRANTRDGWPPCGRARITNVPDPGGRGETTRQMRSAITMDEFAASLVSALGKPVVNETGLDGRFDIAIDYVRPIPGTASNEVPEGPTLTVALEEQLGLRVEQRRAPVPVFVIDAATLPSTD